MKEKHGDKMLYTSKEVATVLGVHEQTVRRWIVAGEIKGKLLYGSPKLGYRVRKPDLITFLREKGGEEKIADIEGDKSGSKVLS